MASGWRSSPRMRAIVVRSADPVDPQLCVFQQAPRDQNWIGPAIPPGEILLEEYLKPLGVGQLKAARRLGISLNRLNEIVLGKRSISADTALRLGRFLKTSPQLWMRLQADWDLHEAMQRESQKAS